MAQVDFSNAVLDVNSSYKPMTYNSYLQIGQTSDMALYTSTGSSINTSGAKSIISNTPTKVSILFTGSFTASGIEFYIADSTGGSRLWKVSNISFSSGDTYSFVIDIEVSGNT